jgi:poly-beta-1,6-N-acetyl-D-glucosamine synthase
MNPIVDTKSQVSPSAASRQTVDTRIACSVGIMAYNEEANVGILLSRLCGALPECARVDEIVVVASGCTDGTAMVARAASDTDPRVRIVEEPTRNGKASAINRFLELTSCEVCVLVGADCIPADDALQELIVPFSDPSVGMTGARPVPLNEPDTFVGAAAHLLWGIHHEVALRAPKCGEMIAFRRAAGPLPEDTVVDEPQIARRIAACGLRIVYCPDAIVYNMGPATIREILMRRRSITAGYLRLSCSGPPLPSARRSIAFRAALSRFIKSSHPRLWITGIVALEAVSRVLGFWDAHHARGPLHIWAPAPTTKNIPLDRIRKQNM